MGSKKILQLTMLLFFIASCKGLGKPKYEDYNEEDFIAVQGIVYKVTRTPVVRLLYYEVNAYYIYNLDSEHPKIGKEMDVPVVVEEGDPQVILIHKDDENISFMGRGRTINREVLENYRKKSKEHGVDYYGVE